MNTNNFIDTTFDEYYLNPYKLDKFNFHKNNYYDVNKIKSSSIDLSNMNLSNMNLSLDKLNDNKNLNLIIKTLTSIIMSETNLNHTTNNDCDKFIIFKLVANNQIDELKEFFLNNSTYDINIQDADGDTALHIAIFLSNFEACEILIKNNANLFIKDKWGQVPLHRICFALENKNIISIIKLIDKYQNLIINNKNNNIDDNNNNNNKLIKFNENNIFNSVDKFNNTPLHLVIKYIIKNRLKLNKNLLLIIKKLKSLTNINIINSDGLSIGELLELLNAQI